MQVKSVLTGLLRMKAKDLARAAMFTVFIALCSYIKIPLPVIPFTLQVFAVSLCALCLSRLQAFLAISLYVLIGLLGIPVFAGGVSGPQVILMPSFGFILGFIPMTLIINTLYHKLPRSLSYLAFIAGSLSLYIIALPVLYFNLKILAGITLPLSKLLLSYWLFFIPTDILSMFLSYQVQNRFLSHLRVFS